MLLDLVFRNMTRKNAFSEAFFRSLVIRTLRTAGASGTAQVSISLVGPQRMRSLNREYRKRDTPTDVLSFPLAQAPFPGYTGGILGDIFLCPSYAAARAAREGVSLREKMSWLVVHGMLHLLGYDHERSEKEARTMERLEKKILES